VVATAPATRQGGSSGEARWQRWRYPAAQRVKAEAAVCFAKQRHGWANEMKGAWGREKKETPDTPYIHRWRHVTDQYLPRIFVGDVASSMNIWFRSKSNQTAQIWADQTRWPIYGAGQTEHGITDEYMGCRAAITFSFIDAWPKPMNMTLYSSVSEPTNIILIYSSVPTN
jgi:hypothetical protein